MTEAKLWKYENDCVFNRRGYLDQIQKKKKKKKIYNDRS